MDATYVRNLCNSIHLKEGVKARLLLLFTTEKYKEATQSELLSILTETSRPTLSRSLNQLINSEEKILSSNYYHGICVYSIANENYKTVLSDEESKLLIELCSAPLVGNSTNIFRIALALLDLDRGKGVTMDVLMKEYTMFKFEVVKEGLSKMKNLQIVNVDEEKRMFFIDKNWKYDYLDWLLEK